MDHQILEMFTVGGTDVLLHKYLGPDSPADGEGTADQPVYDKLDPTNIQDLLFLENRDRKYDQDIYSIRGIYNVQDIDFNLSQFGLFLDNDTLFLTVHINASVKTVGRKIISGDVIELPHLRDEHAANDFSMALKRFYVVEDVTRASEGFSHVWYPHLYRLKLKQIVDSQEYRDILDLPADEDTPGGDTLRDLLSSFDREQQVNQAVVDQAEADAPQSGYDVSHYYTLSVDEQGVGAIETVDAQPQSEPPSKLGYDGYLVGSDFAPNGGQFGHGIQFPADSEKGDYFLRTDFAPKRLFQYTGEKWIKVHDVDRMTMTNSSARQTQKTSYINNTAFVYNDLAASDHVQLSKGDTEIHTAITDIDNSLYLVLKYDSLEKIYVLADHAALLTTEDSTAVTVNLPEQAGTQDAIPYSGVWSVKFYRNREAERQSLSQALRPRSDNL